MVELLQCGVDCKKYYCQSSHRLWQERLSKQLTLSVNRFAHVQLKGNLKKKMKLKDIFRHEDAMAKEFCDEKNLKGKKVWDTKYFVEIGL